MILTNTDCYCWCIINQHACIYNMTRLSVESWTHHTSQELANYIDVLHPMPRHWEIGPLSQQLFWIRYSEAGTPSLCNLYERSLNINFYHQIWDRLLVHDPLERLLSHLKAPTFIGMESQNLTADALEKLSDQTFKTKTITLFLTDGGFCNPLLVTSFLFPLWSFLHCENWLLLRSLL